MNANDYFDELCQIYETSRFDKKLFEELNQKNISDIKINMKIYLLKFLFDTKSELVYITKKTDFWFLKDAQENKELIEKYINFSIKCLKSENIDKILNPFNIINNFINTNIEKKLIIMSFIIERIGLPFMTLFLFLGFFVGSKEPFIRSDYLNNLFILVTLNSGEDNESDIEEDEPKDRSQEKIEYIGEENEYNEEENKCNEEENEYNEDQNEYNVVKIEYNEAENEHINIKDKERLDDFVLDYEDKFLELLNIFNFYNVYKIKTKESDKIYSSFFNESILNEINTNYFYSYFVENDYYDSLFFLEDLDKVENRAVIDKINNLKNIIKDSIKKGQKSIFNK